MNALRIYFRQHQIQDANNNNRNVIVDCSSTATYVPGNVDQTWYEMTHFTQGLEKFQSTWDAVNNGTTTDEAGSNYDKGITLSLTFDTDAFQFIWDHLLTTSCQILNSIDVRIDDVICGKSFRLFEIKCDNLTYQPYMTDFENDVRSCTIDVQLREQDLIWNCVSNTFIWDDWQNWFNSLGRSTKDHPTFLTCVEPRPRLMNSVRIALMFFYHSNPAVNAIDFITGGEITDDVRRILDINNFVPAPFIRDYISNIAGKCGMAVDTIFHREGTPEYNACIFHPFAGQVYVNDDDTELSPSAQFIFENRWDVTIDEFLNKLKTLYCAEWYVTPNNTVLFKPVIELLTTSPIYDFTTGDLPVYNLTYTFDGNKKPAYGRYQYQSDGSDLGCQEIAPLYNDMVSFDGPFNNPMMEGELTKNFEFAPTAFVRDGRTKDYIKELIADGETGALILVGLLAVLVAALFAGTLSAGAGIALGAVMAVWVLSITSKSTNMRNHFTDPAGSYTGAVRMVMSNQTTVPRVLIWDGADMKRAKVVKTTNPPASSYYNPAGTPLATGTQPAPIDFVDNATATPPTVGNVTGDKYIIPSYATGVWAGRTNQVATWNGTGWDYSTATTGTLAAMLFGVNVGNVYLWTGTAWIANVPGYSIGTDNPGLNIYNYPMYFKGPWTGNLFDRFHDNIDNPLKSLESNQSFQFETDMCSEALTLLGLWQDDFVKIGYLLILERRANYTVYGRIGNIQIDYSKYTITIKGTVLKNLAFLPPDTITPPTPPPVVVGFDYTYGQTDLDTTGAVPTEAEYVGSIVSGVTATAANTGDNVSADFTNTSDKVLYIEVPDTEAPFTMWTEVGNSLQQNQPIDPTFAGSNVWFKTSTTGKTIYITRSQTSFGGEVILSR